ncbi:MAG: transporter substrate-binding protein [Hyphomicrobiales bacterium]|nr:transporter substrate-binding protein [Hyphomicrobiales bacterium]
MSITLKGMTWSHPRGYDPLVATSRLWHEKTGVEIVWDKRSLQDFESFPVEEMARAYDLIVIDHPHVGQITAEKCLAPLDVPGRETEREALAQGSVGQSYPSYAWQGRQWAFPIDAATQVQVYRSDLLEGPVRRWDEVVALARQGRVILPMRPPHSLMSFYTLCANLGRPCAVTGPGDLIDLETGSRAVEMLAELAALIDPADFDSDPIAASEAMAEPGTKFALMPLGYGYVSYALDGFRPNRLTFADIPAAGENGPAGSALGGTGIAVSAFSEHTGEAIDFAYWVASADVQRGLYASSGGQPGHATAWEDGDVNRATHDFYSGTRATLEGAWVRPRHDGYMAFQAAASARLNAGLLAKENAGSIVVALNTLFQESF